MKIPTQTRATQIAGSETADIRPTPSLYEIGRVFALIGVQSFGGGMTAWIRREVVQRQRWLGDQQFVGGLALAQITPGANSINLAVYIGTTLRGRAGALAALFGMLFVPVIVVLAMGAAFASVRAVPGVESAMVGLGAAAIGLNLANGVIIGRRSVRTPASLLIVLVTTVLVGVMNQSLVLVLAVMIPLSLLLAGKRP
jgi:chromate transporter